LPINPKIPLNTEWERDINVWWEISSLDHSAKPNQCTQISFQYSEKLNASHENTGHRQMIIHQPDPWKVVTTKYNIQYHWTGKLLLEPETAR
jgi:hypothetical protein